MRRVKASLRAIGWLLIGSAFAGCALAQASSTQPPETAARQVWVARRGWHIDLGLAIVDLRAPLRSVAENFPRARYIFFGFGDRRYLTAKRHGSSSLAAALWPGAGLTLATAIGVEPKQAFGGRRVLALALSDEQMRRLQNFIWESFEVENQKVVKIGEGPYEGSQYFAALPRYSGLHTCNTWAAEGLAAAQLPVYHRFVLLAGQLWAQLSTLSRQSAHAEPSLAELRH